jgi:hypothetical protein
MFLEHAADMEATDAAVPSAMQDDHPRAADLRAMMKEHPLPALEQGVVNVAPGTSDEASALARNVLDALNAALAGKDATALKSCFFPSQTYWKDSLSLTWDLRTFTSSSTVAEALLQTKTLRGLDGQIRLEGAPQLMPVTPVLVREYIY